MKILIIDNYDSFAYNHYLEQLAEEVEAHRNDAIGVKNCKAFSHIVISPGPELPAQAGITMEVIEEFHQTNPSWECTSVARPLAEFFGAKLYSQNMIARGIQRKMIT